MRLGRLLISASTALLLLGGCSDGQSDGDQAEEATTTTSQSAASEDEDSVVLSDPELERLVGCATDCEVTGTIDFDHPSWGPSTIVTTAPPSTCGDVTITAINEGAIEWQYEERGNCFSSMVPIDQRADTTVDEAIDSNGHLFLSYSPGRDHGIIVLAPSEDGFDDFGTLPASGGAFAYADVVGGSDDGAFIIETYQNDCDPSCADGTVTAVAHTFDGNAYVSN